MESLAVDLNSKNWIDSIVQQNPANEDYVVSGKIGIEGSKAVTLINLNAPGGKTFGHLKSPETWEIFQPWQAKHLHK